MDNWLILLGILIIALALWKERKKENHITSEVNNYKQIRDELVTAKKEVQVLMEQLEAASEKIVEEISVGLEEIKHHSEQLAVTADTTVEEFSTNDVTEQGKEPVAREIPEFEAAPVKKKVPPIKKKADNTIVFPSQKSKHWNKEAAATNEHPALSTPPPKQQMVYAMATMGYTEEEIARQMKIGKGEVSLMLQLKRKGEKENV